MNGFMAGSFCDLKAALLRAAKLILQEETKKEKGRCGQLCGGRLTQRRFCCAIVIGIR
jgi:hypothetical protein